MTEEERLAKNKRISQSGNATRERHKNMALKTFTVKIQKNKLSKQQKEALETIFLEQKWYKNYILNWVEQNENNKISKFDTKQTIITKKDKNMNDIPVVIKYLSAQSRQCLVSRMLENIKTLHTLKTKRLQKPGKLKFSKEETIVDLKQYKVSHKIISSKRIKVAGIPKTLVVNGLKQFINIEGIEYANARLLHKTGDYYFQITCFLPRQKETQKINKNLGIDFGCQTSFTTSEGEKISIKIPESERLKRLQKSFSKKKKGSKNWLKQKLKIQKEYQKISNQKNDIANKIIHKFSQYETVIIQDEQLSNWHKSGHGKAVQYSVLGKVKQKLITKTNVVVLGKTVPTTKLCTNCGVWHDELKLKDRVFKCNCGVEEDRDIHSAKNMIWFYKNNVGVERTKFKRVEIEALVNSALVSRNQPLLKKHEASTF